MAGFVSQDTMKIGDLVVEEQDFGEATTFAEVVFGDKVDGVFGLGFQGHAVNLVVPPFYKMINKEGLLADPVFAFYFGNVSKEGDEAEILFGGINDDHFIGDLVPLPIQNRPTWEVEFNALTFGEDTFVLENTVASLDTGSAMIGLPSNLAQLM